MKEYFVWLFKLLTLLVIFVVIVPLLIVSVTPLFDQESPELSGAPGKKTVAVIELAGMITSSKDVLEALYKQIKNERIQGIVLRVDSPGGAVGPSQDMYAAVRKLKKEKPIVASMGAIAASGGLYASLGASKVYAQPGTVTGSIGVILQLPNFRKVTDLIGVEMITIKSGQFKDVGNSFREMSEEERQFLQQHISAAHADFIQAVVDGRSIPRERVVSFADGRVLLGSQAKELGLVDEFGDVYDAARGVYDVLGTPLKEGEYPELYYPTSKYAQVKKLLEGASRLSGLFSKRVELRYEMY